MALVKDYPWISPSAPLIVSAPMMKISLAEYALATSSAGGIGFLAGGFDLSPLKKDLATADEMLKSGQYPNLTHQNGRLPIGVGVQNWGTSLDMFIGALEAYPVAAAWFFAPKQISDLGPWVQAVNKLNPATKIWVQVGTVGEAREVVTSFKVDVLVIQGADAGGHGLAQRAGIVTLLPEVYDMLREERVSITLIAAGGIMDGRSVAAAYTLGADGICMGTRLLASHEAKIAKGYQQEVLRVSDGGVSTIGTTVYDRVRGIKGWPASYDGRGIINKSFTDFQAGMSDHDNEKLYLEEMKKGDEGWGPHGRMTTYAGTGVGLVKEVLGIEQIVTSVRGEALEVLDKARKRFNPS